MKKVLILLRTSIKVIVLILAGLILISGIVFFVYKPTYAVTLGDELLGYTKNKNDLQKKVNEYIKKGADSNVAFVEIENLPKYRLCLSKEEVLTNNDEMLDKIKETGEVYYRYFAVTLNGEERNYVGTRAEAEETINKLNEKQGGYAQNFAIVEKIEKSVQAFTNIDEIVIALYVEPPVSEEVVTENNYYYASSVYTPTDEEYSGLAKLDGFINPVSGLISSRFGYREEGYHTGIDIAAPNGTPISAAAGGIVVRAGWEGSYGILVVISHGDGMETYYAHCSEIIVSAGEAVSQGEIVRICRKYGVFNRKSFTL